MDYSFVKSFDTITDQVVKLLFDNSIGVVIINNAKKEDINQFGNIVPQDIFYGLSEIPIGTLDKTKQHVYSTTEMLWHSDGSYSKDVHPIVGLFCISASEGSSPTYFCDMQSAYSNANLSLIGDVVSISSSSVKAPSHKSTTIDVVVKDCIVPIAAKSIACIISPTSNTFVA